jgi:hypothetical protein
MEKHAHAFRYVVRRTETGNGHQLDGADDLRVVERDWLPAALADVDRTLGHGRASPARLADGKARALTEPDLLGAASLCSPGRGAPRLDATST